MRGESRGGVSTCAPSRADSGLSPQGWVLTQLLCLFLASLKTRGVSWGSEAVVAGGVSITWFWESHALTVLGQEPRSSVRASGLLQGVFVLLLGSTCCPARADSWGECVLQQRCFCCCVPPWRGGLGQSLTLIISWCYSCLCQDVLPALVEAG